MLRGGFFLRFQPCGEAADSVTLKRKLPGARLCISDGLLEALLQCLAGGLMLLTFCGQRIFLRFKTGKERIDFIAFRLQFFCTRISFGRNLLQSFLQVLPCGFVLCLFLTQCILQACLLLQVTFLAQPGIIFSGRKTLFQLGHLHILLLTQ